MEMESEDPVRRRPIPTRVKIIMTCIMLALSAGAISLAVFVGKREGFEAEKWPKPFGLGVGPAFIGGQDTTWAGDEFVFDLYAAYRRYNLVTGKTTNEDQEYYERWTSADQCIGSCREHSLCQDGVCVCDSKNEFVQLFGRCFAESTAFLKQGSSDLRFRKPSAPPIPDSCYTKVKTEGKTKTILDPNQAHLEACQKITFPNRFDETNLTCERSDHRSCLEYDTNMYCAPTGRCVCRLDMAFNKKNMECDLLVDVDCKEETGYDFVTDEDQEALEIVTGGKQIEDGRVLDKEKARKAFCVFLDGKADTYNGFRQGEFTLIIWGLNLGGFIILLFALAICGSTLCFCFYYITDFIHFLDPRNAMAAITANQEMSGLA
eukprot:TRINITY_DN17875_c0_g1_i1.p1 TRINITY_DN17875_c0_g1~~TRINITY_DN17875_c0_g1_i1.p1  ORF type:complete len:405 (-),score=95.47 TRINITY_DN17875_c0_g1_i1:333-1460(-)